MGSKNVLELEAVGALREPQERAADRDGTDLQLRLVAGTEEGGDARFQIRLVS